MWTMEQFFFSVWAIINIVLLKARIYMNKVDNVLTQEKDADDLGRRN